MSFGREDGVPLFYADSGDLHLKYPEMTRSDEREYRLKGKFFVKVHEHLHIDAQGVGDLDLALGWPYFKDIYAGSSIPVVCANLFEKASGARPFPSFVVREKDGIKVAFIGALSNKPDAALPRAIAAKLEVKDPEPLIKEAIAELDAEKPDLVVLVSHLGRLWDVEVAQKIPGLDLILGGHSGERLVPPIVEAGVPILQAGKRGKEVGRIDLWYNPDGEPGAEEYKEQHKETRKTKADFPKKLTFVHRLEQIKKAFEEDATVAAWLAEYKEMIHKLPPLESDLDKGVTPGAEAPPVAVEHYWGSDTCSKCHKAQAEWWQNTTHATAFKTLADIKMEKSGDCIGCHSIGYKEAGGFSDPSKIGNLKNVGCENCHGKGDNHGQLDKFNTSPRDPKTCTVCHTPERDTTWDVKKIDEIACPTLDVAPVGSALPESFMKPKKPGGEKKSAGTGAGAGDHPGHGH